MTQPRDYQPSTLNPISTLPAYDGDLGARLTADGTAIKKAVNQAEYDRLRLEAARKLDEEMYKDE